MTPALATCLMSVPLRFARNSLVILLDLAPLAQASTVPRYLLILNVYLQTLIVSTSLLS